MAENDAEFEALLEYIRDERGFDFTGYKRASLQRRVARHMAEVGAQSYDGYRDYLELNSGGFTGLFNTILINVTSFFRDADSWDYLAESILPELVDAASDRPIRVWSAGCATGEEAYSVAMLLADRLSMQQFRERVKIYATDIDEDALAQARQATYDDRALRAVSEERREKYFERVGARFVFHKDLRRSVIFGRNDLVQDAPISHVDLLLCRNTLMYFNAVTQAQVLQRLHFALKPDGVLFLGKAEMLLSHSDLFRPIELRRRFFRRVSTRGRNRQLPLGQLAGRADEGSPRLSRVREHALLSAPSAQVVLDDHGLLAMYNRMAERLFTLGPEDLGRPLQDLELSYRPLELRSHVSQAARDGSTVWVRDVEWARAPNEHLTFDVQIVPISEDGDGFLGTTIIFNDVTRFRQLQIELEYANRQLETAYEELQSTNEELETTNEELQSTVEELETTNEELQSTNEELETMNEELQSMNDELHATNDELQERTSEIDHLNHFMAGVLGSMRAGVIVVDPALKVLVWNDRSEDLWGVRGDEAVGQFVLNLDIGLPVEHLRPALHRALSADSDGYETVKLLAINRRGRQLEVEVTVSPLRASDELTGAVIVMDPDS